MEYFDLAQERMETLDRELAALRLSSEARRLNPAPHGPFAAFDSLIIRAGKGASARQARREYGASDRHFFA